MRGVDDVESMWMGGEGHHPYLICMHVDGRGGSPSLSHLYACEDPMLQVHVCCFLGGEAI